MEALMGPFSKPWSELTFADNYIFCKVLEDRTLCKRFIEILLGITVEHLETPTVERVIEPFYKQRGIRLDVYVKGEEDGKTEIFDLEMQTGNYDDILLRTRYYQGISDVTTTKRRTQYSKLKETYIVFICKEDPFGAGLPCYTKQTKFAETDALAYDDKTHAIFYNASAWSKVENPEAKSLLRFIYEGTAESVFSKQLETSVDDAKISPEEEGDYMYFIDILEEEKEAARAEAREQAFADGITEGMLEEQKKTAVTMQSMGLTLEQIATALRVTKEKAQEYLQ